MYTLYTLPKKPWRIKDNIAGSSIGPPRPSLTSFPGSKPEDITTMKPGLAGRPRSPPEMVDASCRTSEAGLAVPGTIQHDISASTIRRLAAENGYYSFIAHRKPFIGANQAFMSSSSP